MSRHLIASTLQSLLQEATGRLRQAGLATPRLDAEVLLRHVLGIDRTQLFLRLPEVAPTELPAHYESLLARRLAGEPVAYITETREFMGMGFRVTPAVLVPRPETELLVEWALDWLATRPDSLVADIGTGSGAIAVAIAALRPITQSQRTIAIDASLEAVEIARQNAVSLLRPPQQARFRSEQGSLMTTLTPPVDLVLANLPYLTPEQLTGNPNLAAEPSLALDGGTDGLDLVRDLIADLPRVLVADGAVGLELDPSQTEMVTALLSELFPDAEVRTIHDLAGLPRHVVMTR